MKSISGAIFPASSGCFTPGGALEYHPHIHYIAPEGLFQAKTAAGIPRGSISICR